MEVRFYETVDDSLIKFAVIIARYQGKNVFCKHRGRDTLEIPGGHREAGEAVDGTARRELWEETGAEEFEIRPVCVYSVVRDGCPESFGKLYYAEVTSLEPELHSEIEKIVLLDGLPDQWTYPLIQPELMREAARRQIIPVF